MIRIYLAGPEVFLPDAVAVGEAKKRICAAHGLAGVFPLDDPPDDPPDAAAIYARCLAMMRNCQAVVAKLTPFRGIGADAGTAFELGFMAAAGKPLFGYSNVAGTIRDRTRSAAEAGSVALGPDEAVEDFGHFDNLMLAEALRASGGVLLPDGPAADPARDLATFRRAVVTAAVRLRAGSLINC